MTRARILLLLLLVLATVVAWQQGWLADPSPVASPTPAPPPPFQAAWATEQDWLVDRITGDVREMGNYAATGAAQAAGSAVALPAPAIRFELHLFSPRLYEPIALEALGRPATLLAATPDDDREDARLLATLVDPRDLVLVAEDLALSSRLEVTPRDPGAHERAALLLAAFALSDSAGDSTDTRPALTRLTAHVALARALRGGAEPGLARVYAEAALVTLLGRESDATERLDALAATAASPAEKAWVRALRLRNTGDWRIAHDAGELTLLETREEFGALVEGQGDEPALAWLDPREPVLVLDWGRLALGARAPSEATRHRFADVTTALDLAQATEVLTRLRGAPADESALLDALNERPRGTLGEAGKPHVAVLGWELWADRFQRDLVFDLVQNHRHCFSLASPGERRDLAERSRARFGRLRLYPIVQRSDAEDVASYRTAMAAVRELALRSPERLTGGHWRRILAPERFAHVPRDLPDPNAWFRPALPQGTLLDVEARLEVMEELLTIRDPELRVLRELAPHNLALARRTAARLPEDRRSAVDLVAVYGSLADYQAAVMAELAQAPEGSHETAVASEPAP